MTQLPRDDFAKQIISLLEHGLLRITHKPWGHELVIETDAFLLKLIDVDGGQQTSLQRHDIKDEVQYVIDGDGGVFVQHDDGFAEMVRLGEHVRVQPGTVHRTIGPVTLIEVTTLHDDDITRLKDDYGRADDASRQVNAVTPVQVPPDQTMPIGEGFTY